MCHEHAAQGSQQASRPDTLLFWRVAVGMGLPSLIYMLEIVTFRGRHVSRVAKGPQYRLTEEGVMVKWHDNSAASAHIPG